MVWFWWQICGKFVFLEAANAKISSTKLHFSILSILSILIEYGMV